MKPLTTLGLDGMPPFFYKSYWNIVGSDVIDATLSVLNSGIMPPNINHTFITLIPKKKSPTSPKDFYPISLYNVMYKIISKTIANRLKNILPKLVSETQSAFMSDHGFFLILSSTPTRIFESMIQYPYTSSLEV